MSLLLCSGLVKHRSFRRLHVDKISTFSENTKFFYSAGKFSGPFFLPEINKIRARKYPNPDKIKNGSL